MQHPSNPRLQVGHWSGSHGSGMVDPPPPDPASGEGEPPAPPRLGVPPLPLGMQSAPIGTNPSLQMDSQAPSIPHDVCAFACGMQASHRGPPHPNAGVIAVHTSPQTLYPSAQGERPTPASRPRCGGGAPGVAGGSTSGICASPAVPPLAVADAVAGT